MKKILFLLLTIAFFSCDTPVKKEAPKPVPVVVEPIKEVVEEKKIEKVDNTLVKLKRKPCSGDCPVFDVTITKDSILTYNGKKFTNIKGVHTVKLSAKQFDKISKILDDSKFSELNSKYTKSGTKDYAESIITYQGKNVTIRLWKDAPKRLTAIYVFIEDILYDKKYLE
jgi:hypothetical protein